MNEPDMSEAMRQERIAQSLETIEIRLGDLVDLLKRLLERKDIEA